jgi:putative (di)nucleoside polyphosphate hydrolase
VKPDRIAKLPYRPCVGVMLVNGEGKVFVGQRLDRDHDAWQMPQGGIDKGEDVVTAALRELSEETGITAEAVELVAVTDTPIAYDLPPEIVPTIWGGRYRGQAQHWVLLRFLGTDDQVNIATRHPEFSAWEWCAPEALVPRIVPFKRAVYEQVFQRFAPLIPKAWGRTGGR